MKLFLIWPSGKPEIHLLLKQLQSAGHEVLYWVGERPAAHLAPEGAIFHDHYDAWAAKPDSQTGITVMPPERKLIEEMRDTESLVMPMMNKRYDAAGVDERKQIYFDMLGYWHSAIKQLKPEAIVFGTIPHSIYGYIVFDLARKHGIPVITSEPTWIAVRHLWYYDFWKGNAEFRANIKKYWDKEVQGSHFGDEMREYWEEHTGERARTEPVYTAVERSVGEGWGKVIHRIRTFGRIIFNGHLLSMLALKISQFGRGNLRKDYARVEKPADLSKPFVYFPLHFQPECTTTPQGGVFHQQILVAETLSAALPVGWELYIKEHPGQWWTRSRERYSSVRYPGYYGRLTRIPHTRLVPANTNTYDLTDRAKAVAVINGTAGWEALMRGKLPLVFGVPWWREYPGVFHVDSVESCKAAFQKIETGARTNEREMLSFLKAMEESTTRSYIMETFEKAPRVGAEENMLGIAAQVNRMLARLEVKPRAGIAPL